KVLESEPNLKEFQGELRGGRYAHLLSGVFSARMWIKQRNTAIENLFEKYSEPLSTISWAISKPKKFLYPRDYLLTGLKWLQKNAPHDSICGCSVDEVHNEMSVRFDWAEQIGEEIFKNSFLFLSDCIKFDDKYRNGYSLIVYNPLPWKRKDVVRFNTISRRSNGEKLPYNIKLIDGSGREIEYQYVSTEEDARFTRKYGISHNFSFLAEVPALGYNTFYILQEDSSSLDDSNQESFKISREMIENEFYRIDINPGGFLNVLDKETGILYENLCEFEDRGDWGDEYDFSGPMENQTDFIFTTEDASVFERSVYIDGPTQKTFKLRLNLKLPHSLTEDRYNREEWLVDNKIIIFITLYRGIKRIDFKIILENNSKDHRIRILFPTKIKTDRIDADGHFYVVPRSVKLPKAEKWAQKPLPTNHQRDFVSVNDDSSTFAVINKGLPEYEAIINQDNTITIAITLLRCIEWLSRDDFLTRRSHAGPGFQTPGAQCLGIYEFELSITSTSKTSWVYSEIHLRGKEFNNPLKPIFPNMVKSPIRTSDKLMLTPSGVISYFVETKTDIIKPYLPHVLSFLEINNSCVLLSAMKKAEEGEYLIIRVYNIASTSQNAILKFYKRIILKNVKIVNLLEENPEHRINARIISINNNILKIEIDSHVIVTFKIKFNLLE
ncbi:MAG: glycoside hydrolase family 38 C-terminal domain-containing protein, partial [Candidatus Thorarchaeota archaeon]